MAWPDLPDPSLPDVVARLADYPEAWGWTLSGGEPTIRADLPDLIAALRSAGAPCLGLATDGWALTRDPVVDRLRAEGLQRVRIPLHCGRADAHDWLVKTPGAARRVRRAIETCLGAGLEVEIDTALTRPTLPHLEETVELVSVLGASAIHFHRPVLTEHNAPQSVALSPRMGLLEPHLRSAFRAARRRALRADAHGLPECVLADVEGARPGTEIWVLPTDSQWRPLQEAFVPGSSGECSACPDTCAGAPADYVLRFGKSEFSEFRPPSRKSTSVIDVHLDAAESSRQARTRLMRAVRQHPDILRLTGEWMQHPDALSLLGETRLLLPEVRVVGEVNGLRSVGDRVLGALAGHCTIEVVCSGPPEGSEGVLEKLRSLGVEANLLDAETED